MVTAKYLVLDLRIPCLHVPPRPSSDPVYCVCGGTGLAKVRVRIREPVNPEIKIERAKVPLQIAVCGNFDIIGHVSRIFQRYTSHYAPCDMAYFCAHACAHAYRMLIDACNLMLRPIHVFRCQPGPGIQDLNTLRITNTIRTAQGGAQATLRTVTALRSQIPPKKIYSVAVLKTERDASWQS